MTTAVSEFREGRQESLTEKRVQWADELESVCYFVTPRSLREDLKKKIKKLKKIAGELTERPVRAISQFGEASISAFDFITNYGQSGSFDTKMLTYEDLVKECDRLFELCEAEAVCGQVARSSPQCEVRERLKASGWIKSKSNKLAGVEQRLSSVDFDFKPRTFINSEFSWSWFAKLTGTLERKAFYHQNDRKSSVRNTKLCIIGPIYHLQKFVNE